MTFKRWVLTTWLQEKSGSWDCVKAIDIAASEVAETLAIQNQQYGPPMTIFSDGGETVSFKWKDGPYAEMILRQKPCN